MQLALRVCFVHPTKLVRHTFEQVQLEKVGFMVSQPAKKQNCLFFNGKVINILILMTNCGCYDDGRTDLKLSIKVKDYTETTLLEFFFFACTLL